MPDLICFDFDGTLVDSVEPAFNAFREVGPAFGCAPIEREALDALRGLHAREIVRVLGVPFYRIPQFVTRMRHAMRAELMETPPVDGVREMLSELARRGYRLGVLSSNAGDSLNDYVVRHRLEGLDFIRGGAGLFRKAAALRRILAKECVVAERLLYVGDELRDLEAARAAGVGFAAVGWGYTALDRLAAAGPDCLLERPADLLECVGTTDGSSGQRGATPDPLAHP